MYRALFLCAGLLAVTGLPVEDPVLFKYDDGDTRYQYVPGPQGVELVDLWFKKSDLIKSDRYDPNIHNHYHLFTRQNPSTSQPIPLGEDQILRSSNFDPRKKTVVIIHGWKNTPTSMFNVYMVHSYLVAEDVNLIMLDWSVGADALYVVAINNVIRSADHVSRYLRWLTSSTGCNIDHIIGHSLGAHQAGVVGRQLGGNLPYLTGLDPAMPGWITNTYALSTTAASYVEVMHTNGGAFGLVRASGHVDFYPNGGVMMPGCDDNDCSHHQCIYYMAESLMYGGFTGRRCDTLIQALNGNCRGDDTLRMGGTRPKTGQSGLFHLTTNAWSPFSQG